MTVRRNFYPLGMYRFMLDMATDQKLAVDEVAFNVLRIGLSELGFTCDHTNMGYSKNDQQLHSKPYCKNCYSRLYRTEDKRVFKGKIITEEEYTPLETFIDRERKELVEKSKAENEHRIKIEVDADIKKYIGSLMKNDIQESEVPSG